MVEGHQCHRVAQAHRKVLVGKKFNASSPNGRFVDGAKAVHQQTLKKIEVHGKNLFYFFGEAEPVVVHIHFGMSGNFRISPQPGPAPTETTRLRMESEELGCVAHLSAMTVQHGGLELYEEKSSKLGPDPLRSDADKERLWAKMNATKKPIGLVLMDQSCVAGIGNIYRAEILFKAGLHPEQPANTVDRAAFERIWRHSVLLLQRGFVTGSILTVDPEEAKILGRPWTRRYIYNQASCGRCGSRIQTWDMANRTVYACSGCQKLQHAAKLPSQRKQAMAAAQDTRLFTSHCAPDDPEEVVPEKMTVAELKQQLKARNLPVSGNKPALLERLAAALASAKQEDAGGELNAEEPSQNDPAAVPASTAGVQPGTEHLPEMASARMAEKEKEAAGENRAVEHVALHFDLDMNSGSDAETDAKLAPSPDPVESRTAAGDGGRKKAAAGRKRPPARRENRSAASLTPQPRKRRAQRAEDGGDTSPKLDADDVSAAALLPTKSESPRPRRSRRTARRGADVTASAQAALLEPDVLKSNQGIRAMA